MIRKAAWGVPERKLNGPKLETEDHPQYELSQNSFFSLLSSLTLHKLKNLKLALKKHQLIFSTDVVRIRFLHFWLFGWYSQYMHQYMNWWSFYLIRHTWICLLALLAENKKQKLLKIPNSRIRCPALVRYYLLT